MTSSARAKMPGLLGTTRRLWAESQRDQRDLYRSIRQQLDDLLEAKTHPGAEAETHCYADI